LPWQRCLDNRFFSIHYNFVKSNPDTLKFNALSDKTFIKKLEKIFEAYDEKSGIASATSTAKTKPVSDNSEREITPPINNMPPSVTTTRPVSDSKENETKPKINESLFGN